MLDVNYLSVLRIYTNCELTVTPAAICEKITAGVHACIPVFCVKWYGVPDRSDRRLVSDVDRLLKYSEFQCSLSKILPGKQDDLFRNRV